jgi:ABC-2 type transport system permease protein
VRRTLFLFSRLVSQNVKIKLEYKFDSIVLFFSGMVFQALGFLFLVILFSKVPAIEGWDMWEIAMMLSAIFFTEGVVSFAFEGAWRLAMLVNQGDLDRILLRPVSPILQLFTFDLGIHGVGNMAAGAALFVVSLSRARVDWDLAKILFIPVFAVSGATIRAAISFAAACACFWVQGYSNAFPLMIYQLADFAKYPSSIFGRGIELFIIAIIPYGFISYVPAVYLFGKASWGVLAWLAPVAALWCAFVARRLFYRGLGRYEGAGN